MALQNSPSTQSTIDSPFYIVFGVEMNLPFDIHKIPMDNHLTQNSKQQIQQIFSNLEIVHEIATKNISELGPNHTYKIRWCSNRKDL